MISVMGLNTDDKGYKIPVKPKAGDNSRTESILGVVKDGETFVFEGELFDEDVETIRVRLSLFLEGETRLNDDMNPPTCVSKLMDEAFINFGKGMINPSCSIPTPQPPVIKPAFDL